MTLPPESEGSLTDSDIETFETVMKTYIVTKLLDDETFEKMHPDQIKVLIHRHAVHCAYQFTAAMHVPGKSLPRQLLAEYPASLWQHVKKALGLKHDTLKVWRDASVLFPNIAIPERLRSGARVGLRYLTKVPPTVKDDDYVDN